MKKLLILCVIITALISCNVTETIVFNNKMGGTYKTSYDMSPLMKKANESRPASVEKEKSEVIDTLIVFNDMFEKFSDSIASLPQEEQEKLNRLRGMTLRMNMDEDAMKFEFEVGKEFNTFGDLAFINEEVSEALDMARKESTKNQEGAAQLDGMLKGDPVKYTFNNGVFRRFDPSLKNDDEFQEDENEAAEEEAMGAQIEQQFEEIFKESYYTITYVFPRKIKNTSIKNAEISKDRKTISYKVDWNSINKDNTLLDFEIELEK